MKILYFGGQKSGKSKLAEVKTLQLANKKKPFYIATYDNSFNDPQMQIRINNHKKQRKKSFNTIEEGYNFIQLIKKNNQTYLIDCISMWILNSLNQNEKWFLKKLTKLKDIKSNIVFVLNDVNNGVIPIDKQSRKFVDLTGIIGQKLAQICDEIYEVKFGIEVKIK